MTAWSTYNMSSCRTPGNSHFNLSTASTGEKPGQVDHPTSHTTYTSSTNISGTPHEKQLRPGLCSPSLSSSKCAMPRASHPGAENDEVVWLQAFHPATGCQGCTSGEKGRCLLHQAAKQQIRTNTPCTAGPEQTFKSHLTTPGGTWKCPPSSPPTLGSISRVQQVGSARSQRTNRAELNPHWKYSSQKQSRIDTLNQTKWLSAKITKI